MAEPRERDEVAPGPAAEIEDRERRRADDVFEQRRDVLADVVVLRAVAKALCVLVVVLERARRDLRRAPAGCRA